MPTENRSTPDMVSVPRELLQRIDRMYTEGLSIFGECEEVRALLAQPAQQYQGEPDLSQLSSADLARSWVACSPAWIAAGGNCATAPRLLCGQGQGVSHLHPAHHGQPAAWFDPVHNDFLTAAGRATTISMGDGDRLARYTVPLYAGPTAAEELDSVRHWRGKHAGSLRELDIWKRRAIEAESKLRTYDPQVVELGERAMQALLADPKPAALVLTKCRLCDQLQTDLTERDERIDQLRSGYVLETGPYEVELSDAQWSAALGVLENYNMGDDKHFVFLEEQGRGVISEILIEIGVARAPDADEVSE